MKKKVKNRHAEYYEAILQLRPATTELIDFIMDNLEQRGINISKVIEHKTGLDLYLDSQKYARSTLGPLLKRKFNGKLVITKTLYGVDHLTQRQIYRATVLFKLNK